MLYLLLSMMLINSHPFYYGITLELLLPTHKTYSVHYYAYLTIENVNQGTYTLLQILYFPSSKQSFLYIAPPFALLPLFCLGQKHLHNRINLVYISTIKQCLFHPTRTAEWNPIDSHYTVFSAQVIHSLAMPPFVLIATVEYKPIIIVDAIQR